MEPYIKKSDIIAEIEKRKKEAESNCGGYKSYDEHRCNACIVGFYEEFLEILDTIEVKEVDTWHLQEKENIYDAVKDWSLQTFACVMKDGTIQKFTGNLDEDYEGHINVHIYGANDDYDNVDDIVKWIEFT